MLLFFANINIFSQEKVVHFVFPRFEKATVLYKNNNQSNTELNYNTATEEMIYVGDAGRRKIGRASCRERVLRLV